MLLFVSNIEQRVDLMLYPFLVISLGSAANRIPNNQFVRRPHLEDLRQTSHCWVPSVFSTSNIGSYTRSLHNMS